MKTNIIISFLLMPLAAWASATWTTHLAYIDMQQIAVSPEATYVLSGGNLFAVDRQTDTIRIYTLQDGFAPGKIVNIMYDDVSNAVMVWHQNGYLDYLSASGIRTVSDLYLKEMTAGKTANSICREGNTLYMGMPYGVQTYDLEDETFRLTCYIADSAKEANVQHICIAGNTIYAATDSAIYTASLTSNIVDYRNWTVMQPVSGKLPKGLAAHNGMVYAIWGQKLYRWAGIGWTGIMTDLNFSRIYSEGGRLFGTGNPAALFDLTDLQNPLMYESSELIIDAAYDAENADYWVANNTRGLMHVTSQGTVDYSINSPAVNVPYRMYYGGEKLFVVNGGRWATQYNNAPFIMMYENGLWTNYLPERLQSQASYFRDPMSVAADEQDVSHYWLATYGTGLFEMRNDTVVRRYTAANSPLLSATGNVKHAETYTRVDALVRDAEGWLWMSCTDVGLLALRDSTWLSFTIYDENGTLAPYNTASQGFLDIRNSHRMWLPNCRKTAGIGLLDYGPDIEDQSDDRSLFRSVFHYPDGRVPELEFVWGAGADLDGNVWLCTHHGLFYYSADDDFFTDNTLRRLGPLAEFADYFLKDQRVNCIAVDAHNRKWIGTDALGVYVLNAANDSLLAHYTTANSAMPSNSVLSLAINPVTQEVMIGTGAGLVSCFFTEDPVIPDTPDMPENPDTALDEQQAPLSTKIIRDGRVYIIRSGAVYDLLGNRIR